MVVTSGDRGTGWVFWGGFNMLKSSEGVRRGNDGVYTEYLEKCNMPAQFYGGGTTRGGGY